MTIREMIEALQNMVDNGTDENTRVTIQADGPEVEIEEIYIGRDNVTIC